MSRVILIATLIAGFCAAGGGMTLAFDDVRAGPGKQVRVAATVDPGGVIAERNEDDTHEAALLCPAD